MKTKTIKKINLGLIAILFAMTAGAGFFMVFKNLDHNNFAGKSAQIFSSQQSQNLPGEGVENLAFENEPEKEPVVAIEASTSQNEPQRTDNNAEPQVIAPINENHKFSFVAIGDSDSKESDAGFSSRLEHALKKAKSYAPDLVLFSGDILRMGNDGQSKNRLEKLKSIVQTYHNNYYFAFGNHDIECGLQCISSWEEIFFGKENAFDVKEERKLYHSFDFQNTHFVLLSTDYPKRYSIDEKQFQWLEDDLKANKMPNTIIVQHVPPIHFFKTFSKQCQDMSCDEKMRQKILALYKKYSVDLVISGNENAFDHQIVDGTDFVLSGSIENESEHKGVIKGDIYVLCEVEGEKISLKALTTQGEVIRKIEVK